MKIEIGDGEGGEGQINVPFTEFYCLLSYISHSLKGSFVQSEEP